MGNSERTTVAKMEERGGFWASSGMKSALTRLSGMHEGVGAKGVGQGFKPLNKEVVDYSESL